MNLVFIIHRFIALGKTPLPEGAVSAADLKKKYLEEKGK